MSTYKKSIRVDAPVEIAYESCSSFFTGIGYNIKSNVFPTRIELEKKPKSKIIYLMTDDEIDVYHTLSISLFSEGARTKIDFLYYCPYGMWKFSKKSIEKIESDIQSLTSLIYHSAMMKKKEEEKENSVKEREVIIKEIIKVKCPYCGALVDQGVNRCPNCGAPLK